MGQLIYTDMVVSEKTVIYQMNTEKASESPEHVQMITDETVNYTISSFSNNDLDHAKSTLQINELKEFQIKAISAVREGKDVVVVQPTGSGKSTCYTLPALLYSRKVAIIIEPVVAIITNQVDALAKKELMLQPWVELLVTINHATFIGCSIVHPTYHL